MSAANSGGTNNYVYNALGQLIEKSGAAGTTLIVYDEAGHVLGEYTSTGALIEETVWMGNTPVATLQPDPVSGIDIYYIHSDHLGTPRKITRPSDNSLMWRWDPDTFGSVGSNTNPSGLGTFTYNLGFPGQYYLPETGLYLNYFRDYDPQTGRYIESDPIGLAGGSYSTYAYGSGNPISNSDPLELAPPRQGGQGGYTFPCYFGCAPTPQEQQLNIQIQDNIEDTIDAIKATAKRAAEIVARVCRNDDDDDLCYKEWEREDRPCNNWSFLGTRALHARRARHSAEISAKQTEANQILTHHQNGLQVETGRTEERVKGWLRLFGQISLPDKWICLSG